LEVGELGTNQSYAYPLTYLFYWYYQLPTKVYRGGYGGSTPPQNE